MRLSTPEQFEAELRRLSGHDLKVFMLGNVDLFQHRDTYEKHFGSAMLNFVEACRRVTRDAGSRRLGALIGEVFEDSRITAALNT